MKPFAYRKLLFIFLISFPLISWAQNSRIESKEMLLDAMKLIKADSDAASDMAMRAWDIAEQANDKWSMGFAKSGMGYIGIKMRDYESAFINYTDAQELFEKSDTLDLYNTMDVVHNLAIIHSKFSNYDESIEKYTEAENLAKEYFDKFPDHMKDNGRLKYLVNLPYFAAVQYENKGAHQTAGKMLMKLWEQAEDKGDIVTHARVLNKLGEIKKKNGEYSAALEYFGLVVAEQQVSKKYKSIAYHNLAETYMAQGDYGKAESFYLNALDFKQEIGNARSTFITYHGLGELAYKKGNMLGAIKYWETGLSIFDKVESEPELYSVYNWLQLAYMDIDVEKAKTFNQTYAQLNNFYVRNQTFQREDDADKREALSMLIDKQKQKRVDAAQRDQFIRQFWPVFLGVALLVLFSMILGVRYYMALKANKLLTRTQLKMQQAQDSSNSSQTVED